MIALLMQRRDLHDSLHCPTDKECNSQTINTEFFVEENIIQNKYPVGRNAQCRRDVEFIQRLQDTYKGKRHRCKQHRREQHTQQFHTQFRRCHIVTGGNEPCQRFCQNHTCHHHHNCYSRDHGDESVRQSIRFFLAIFLQIFYKDRDKAGRDSRCKDNIEESTGDTARQKERRRFHTCGIFCRQELFTHQTQYFPEEGDQHHKTDGLYRLIAFFRHNKLLNLFQIVFIANVKGGKMPQNAHHNPPYSVPYFS